MRYCVSPACASRLLLEMSELVVDQRLGAQEVGNAGRHIADLGACGLAMPFGQQGPVEAAIGLLDLEAGADFTGERFVLAEAHQPVERDAMLGGDRQQRLGTGQAGGGAGQQLRQRRAVYAHRFGEGGLIDPRALQKDLEALAKHS